jgi:hypothetical protein
MNATSMVQVNGHMSVPFPIQCSVRQGCPLSMILFALCINPLIPRLEQQLPGHPRQPATEENCGSRVRGHHQLGDRARRNHGNRGGAEELRKSNWCDVTHCKIPSPCGWHVGHNEECAGHPIHCRNKDTRPPNGEHDGTVGDIQLVTDNQHGANPGA